MKFFRWYFTLVVLFCAGLSMLSAQSLLISSHNYLAFEDGNSRVAWSLDAGVGFLSRRTKSLCYLGMDLGSHENGGMGYSLGYSAVFMGSKKVGIDFFVEARASKLLERSFPFYDQNKLWMLGYGLGSHLYFSLSPTDRLFVKIGGQYEKIVRERDGVRLVWETIRPGLGFVLFFPNSRKKLKG